MGKQSIPKTDYVMYFVPEVSIVSIYPYVIPIEAYTREVGVEQTVVCIFIMIP